MYIDVDKGKLGFVKDEKLWGGISTNQTLGENDALVPKVTSSYGGVTVSMKHADSGSKSTFNNHPYRIQGNCGDGHEITLLDHQCLKVKDII